MSSSADTGEALSKKALKRQRKAERNRAKKASGVTHRKNRNQRDNHLGKRRRVDAEPAAHYFVDAESGMLRVRPYRHTFATHVKKRWIGRELQEVFCTEFGAFDTQYYQRAIARGTIRVDDVSVGTTHKLSNGEHIEHHIYRYEPPVANTPICVSVVSADLLVVNKPTTMPVHPCGAHHHCSLTHVLSTLLPERYGHASPNTLRIVHRLDRLTSGLVLLARSTERARDLTRLFAERRVRKRYLALVRGLMPTRLQEQPGDAGVLQRVQPDGEPLRGARRHLPCLRASGSVSGDDDGDSIGTAGLGWRWEHEPDTAAIVASAHQTGGSSAITPGVQRQQSEEHSAQSCSDNDSAMDCLCISHPLRWLSQKDALRECHPAGQSATTIFRSLWYDPSRNVSLVECWPHTGRTHQIRLHLQLIGCPIVNDPLYGVNADLAPNIARDYAQQVAQTSVSDREVRATTPIADSAASATVLVSNTTSTVPPTTRLPVWKPSAHDFVCALPCAHSKHVVGDMKVQCEGQSLESPPSPPPSTTTATTTSSVAAAAAVEAAVAAAIAVPAASVDSVVNNGVEHLILSVTAGHTQLNELARAAAPTLASSSGGHGDIDVDSEGQDMDRVVALDAAVQSLAQEFPQRFNSMQLEHKGICLHATEYFGPGWSYSVEVPQWAKQSN